MRQDRFCILGRRNGAVGYRFLSRVPMDHKLPATELPHSLADHAHRQVPGWVGTSGDRNQQHPLAWKEGKSLRNRLVEAIPGGNHGHAPRSSHLPVPSWAAWDQLARPTGWVGLRAALLHPTCWPLGHEEGRRVRGC